MHRLLSIFTIALLFLIPIPAFSEENQQPQQEQYSPFITPKGNIFVPKTQEQKQTLDKLMQFYIQGNTQEVEKLEETILNDSDFEKSE